MGGYNAHMSKTKKILISAGEASGDMHAANLVRSVHEIDPVIQFYGMGGVNMQQAGVNLIVNSRELAVMGIFDVITHFPKIKAAMSIMWRAVRNDRPNLVILIDYSGFNLRLAKAAKKAGVKVFYYVSPQIWASRQWRVKTVRKYVDVMVVILPFEVDFYKRHGIKAHFVGNPLVNKAQVTMTKHNAQQKFGLNPKRKTVGLFPGSRLSEIKRILPVILEAARLIKEKFPDVQFIMPLASSLTMDDLKPYITASTIEIKIVAGYNYDVMQVCDAIIAVSGTVTLEIALIGTPLVIIYKIFPQYFPIKWVVKIPHIGLCNIIAGKEIAKELLQQQANPKNICAEISRILTDKKYRATMCHELANVKAKLTANNQENLAMLVIKETMF
jgi:lipid-A-disaccharide synthase